MLHSYNVFQVIPGFSVVALCSALYALRITYIPLPFSARNSELVALRKRLAHFAEVFAHNLAAGEVVVRILAGEVAVRILAGEVAVRILAVEGTAHSPAEVTDHRLAVRRLAAADMFHADHNFAAAVAAVAGTHDSDCILMSHTDLAEVHRTAAHPQGENVARLSCHKMNRSPPSVI